LFPSLLNWQALRGGVWISYFKNKNWEGEAVRQERFPGTIYFAWDDTDRPYPAPFSFVVSGEVFIPKSGPVTFYLASDDGSFLKLNQELVIDNGGDHIEEVVSAEVQLKEGWYPFEIKFYDVGGGAVLRLWWKLAGGEEEKIPPKYFRPA